MEQVLRFNPGYLLVLKHFEAKNLPPAYRHPHLWLLTDSQEFASKEEWMSDMRNWSHHLQRLVTRFPIWLFQGSEMVEPKSAQPPWISAQCLIKEMPEFRMLLWVDFTANRVPFGPK